MKQFTPPPPPLKCLTTGLAAALVALTFTGPALAQVSQEAMDRTAVLGNEGATIVGLTKDLLTVTSDSGFNPEITRNLDITASNWSASVAIGTDGRCSSDDEGTTGEWIKDPDKVTLLNKEGWTWVRMGTPRPLVAYHIEDAIYSPGEPIARACTFYTEDGGLQPSYSTFAGEFTLRVYGKISLPGFGNVHSLQMPAPPQDPNTWNWNTWGYHATFKPGANCGPARWPTPELRAAGLPPYAEWCEFVVKARQ